MGGGARGGVPSSGVAVEVPRSGVVAGEPHAVHEVGDMVGDRSLGVSG